MRIPLSNGGFVIVDRVDFDAVSRWKWRKSENGYAVRTGSKTVNGVTKFLRIYLHRFLMKAKPGRFVDHIDRNKLNCSRKNMRLCTQSQNLGNSVKKTGNRSGHKGVSYDPKWKKWVARICVSGKKMSLGSFDKKLDAVNAYAQASLKYFGKFSRV